MHVTPRVTLHLATAIGLSGGMAWAAESEQSQLATALPKVGVTLQQGLTASASTGRPISGKFELEDGKLQLSIYTTKAGKYSEVVVDYHAGKIAETDAISAGDDLVAAQAQAAAMSKAKGTLSAAVDRAEHSAAGYRAVSVAPTNKGGHVVATVNLVDGPKSKSVDEPLN